LDGAGQSVGLFELDGYYPSDITAYENLAGLPHVPLTNVLLNGFNGQPDGNNIEVALDIYMAISMAPGLSGVIVYEGHTPNDILNRMATDNAARQLSCSWGFGPQVDPARQQIFQQFAAQGQSFFQASGDLGAWAGVVFPPSDDPWVTVVGGTALTTGSADGSWVSEAAWPASGGGVSAGYAIPLWQQAVNMTANQGSTAMRNIPDVACLAEEAIWVIVNHGEQGVVGGTSAAAPLWAGFTALVNQQAAAIGQLPVGFVNPAIYAIGQGPDYLAVFHDITTGNNTNGSSPDK
jgi:subtilase family serine protease